MTEFEKMMTVEQVAEKYGLVPATVYKALDEDRLPYTPFGKRGKAIRAEDAEARWGAGQLKPGPKPKVQIESESQE